MAAEIQVSFPTVRPLRASLRTANLVLKAAVRLWFSVVVVGQLTFAFTVAAFYGSAVVRGHLESWNKHLKHGYVPGDGMGNVAVAIHLASAVVIILAGLLQLIPQIRERAPRLHRWNGRVYIVTAFTISIAGLYMLWVRGSAGDLSQYIGNTLLAVLIMLCAVMALRYAIARDFTTHRRWALRLYLVVSASLFIRAGMFLSLLLNGGPFGFDPTTFSGPFLSFISFAQYLVPLAVLEIYLRTQDGAGAAGRFAMAGGMIVLTVALALGIFAITLGVWLPSLRKAFDDRVSISETLSSTIASKGLAAAVKQYHDLKTVGASTYNFDAAELNELGYQLLHTKKSAEAIRIFQLNVEAYPKDSNSYDSLGEAYLKAGYKTLAIANYQQALRLDPKNGNAAKVLATLMAVPEHK
jgi:tetratricopeptide (TPR) repeat protein